MLRHNNGAQSDEFGVEMQNLNVDQSSIENGTASQQAQVDNVFSMTDSSELLTFRQEMSKAKSVLDEISSKGIGNYWLRQTTASKVTHTIIAIVSSILTINFVMAMIAHFVWDRAYLGHHLQDDEILVLYCQTQGCGCENGVLHRLKNLITEHFAGDENAENMKVFTQLYPGAPLIQFWARIMQMIQILLLVTIFFGPMICRKVYGYGKNVEDKSKIVYPYFIQKLSVGGICKKLGMFLVCFIGFNIIIALMTITGAFEIYHGGDLVFSSLESKKMVTPREVMEAFPRLDGKESPLMATLEASKLDTPVGHMH